MNELYKPLFESIQLKSGIQLDNRIVMAPMTNFSSNEDGTVTDAEVKYYARRSNGPGMVITACAYVTPSGKGFSGEFGSHTDEMIPSLRRLASAIKEQGAKAVLQIFHGGRMCPPELVPGGELVSASAVPAEHPAGRTGEQDPPVPRALEHDEILSIIRDFGDSARRAIEAGFDGVEIHGANGYLIQQFFSPHSNRRDDEWGGNLEKRMKFPMAVIDEVQRVASEKAKKPFLIGYRFSPEEPETPGITMEETLALVDALAEKQLDYIHVSLNDFWSKARRGADETKSRMELIQERAAGKVPIIGVGSLYTPRDVLKAFQTGIPLVAMGRELIIDPDWVEKVKQGRESEIDTKLKKGDQERLEVPDPLWNAIIHTPGWFPMEE